MGRNAQIVILLAIVLTLGLLAGGQDRPDFTGIWELKVSQSKFGKMPVPSRMTLHASRSGSVLHAIQTRYDQAGGPDTIEGDWFMDGKQHPIGSDGKMTELSRWDGNTLFSERKSKDNSYDEVIRLTLSSDGKTATENISLKSPNGDNKSTLLWERK